MRKLSPALTFLLGILIGGASVFVVLRSALFSQAPASSAGVVAESWLYMGEATHGLTISPGKSGTICGTIRSQDKGTYEEAWNFYARKCGSSLAYSAGTKRLVGKEEGGSQYVIFDGDATVGLRATSFAYQTNGYTVSVFLGEPEPNHLCVSVIASLR